MNTCSLRYLRIAPLTALVMLALAGCGDPPQTGADAAVPVGDAAAAPDAAPMDTPDAGPASDEVARCVALASTFRGNCAGDATRVCLWEGYAALCATGNTALLIEAMECLDDTACRIFSDANEGGACLAAITSRPAAADAAIEGFCAECGGTMCAEAVPGAEIFPYLPPASFDTLAGCLSTDACTIEGGVAACASAIPALAPFERCGS